MPGRRSRHPLPEPRVPPLKETTMASPKRREFLPYAAIMLILLMSAGLMQFSVQPGPATAAYAATKDGGDMLKEGKQIFRFDTFGSEDFWGGKLRLHEPLEGANLGAAGPAVAPNPPLDLALTEAPAPLPTALGAPRTE